MLGWWIQWRMMVSWKKLSITVGPGTISSWKREPMIYLREVQAKHQVRHSRIGKSGTKHKDVLMMPEVR